MPKLSKVSVTRWSSKNDACVDLNKSWDEIMQVLSTNSTIELNKTEKSKTICEARRHRIQLEKLEMTFMVFLWFFT